MAKDENKEKTTDEQDTATTNDTQSPEVPENEQDGVNEYKWLAEPETVPEWLQKALQDKVVMLDDNFETKKLIVFKNGNYQTCLINVGDTIIQDENGITKKVVKKVV